MSRGLSIRNIIEVGDKIGSVQRGMNDDRIHFLTSVKYDPRQPATQKGDTFNNISVIILRYLRLLSLATKFILTV